ncbi:N-acyl-D-glucosamine 2-epimerase, partial [bacterium]|nr:N-acyl-D-glucosamine 2-epimerase [bacterium]
MELTEDLKQYRQVFENELHDNILSYWIQNVTEKDGTGFYGAVDINNRAVLSANKSCVLNARILWTFAEAAKKYPGRDYDVTAHKAYRVIREQFNDKEFGGYFMEISPSGEVANDIKHSYVQAFVLYALCKYYEFKPDNDLLKEIGGAFRLIDSRTKDPSSIGYLESFTRTWEPYEENRMADNNEPKSMNTHLHLLEAYTALFRTIKGDDLIKKRLKELLEIFTEHIIRKSGHLGIFFASDFSETAGSKAICSFGHDIEASWLIWEAAEVLGDHGLLEKVRPLILQMAEAVYREGFDRGGGLFLESTRYGSHVRTNKHWWLQAEALVGLMNAFQLTGNVKYWEELKTTWNFIDKYVIDH